MDNGGMSFTESMDFPFKVYDPTKEAEELLKNHSPLVAVKGLLSLITSFRQTHEINSDAWAEILKSKDSEIQQLREALKEMYKAIEYGELELRTTYKRFTNYRGSSSLWNMQEMIRKYVYLIELNKPER